MLILVMTAETNNIWNLGRMSVKIVHIVPEYNQSLKYVVQVCKNSW